MFERLTDRANKAVALANQEAKRLNHDHMGSGHLLLGLLAEGTGDVSLILRGLGVDLERARGAVQALSPQGLKIAMVRMLPLSPRATHVLHLAIDEARALKANAVDAEHLLLGMLRETDGVAVHALRNLGVSADHLRAATLARLRGAAEPAGTPAAVVSGCPLCGVSQSITVGAHTSWIATLAECHVVLGENQGCRGWCVVILKGHDEHLAELDVARQQRVWGDVARVAAAIRGVFPNSGKSGGPPRINYECLGNQVAHVHWHVIPRHADDPDPSRPVWGWAEDRLRGAMGAAEREELVRQLREQLEE